MARRILSALLLVHLAGAPAVTGALAAAQARASAIATDVTPVYLRPDGTGTPLRTAIAGSRFVVVGRSGEWVQVEFEDPQHGRRVGWVRRAHVRIDDPATTPMDLSVPPDASATNLRRDGAREVAALTERGEPITVRIVEEIDPNPGRGRMITGTVLLAVGVGLLALEAAYDCHYGNFEICSDEDKLVLVGASVMAGVGAGLAATAPRPKKPTPPRAQLRYTLRF